MTTTYWRGTSLEQRTEKGRFHVIYGRLVVAGRQFVSVRLTPFCLRAGLGAIIPEVVMARPAGAKRRQTTIVRVPIRGKAEWLAATYERSAS